MRRNSCGWGYRFLIQVRGSKRVQRMKAVIISMCFFGFMLILQSAITPSKHGEYSSGKCAPGQWSSSAHTYEEQVRERKRLLLKKNKVKRLVVYEFRYRDGRERGCGKKLFDYRYDTAGYKTESFSYVHGEYHQEFQYNACGDLVIALGYVGGNPVASRYAITYDDKNRRVFKGMGANKEEWFYTYDSLGNLIRIKWYLDTYPESCLYFNDEYFYNEKHQVVKMTRYQANNTVYFSFIYAYDLSGNRIRESRIQHGKITDIRTFSYDRFGNETEFKAFSPSTYRIYTYSKTKYDERNLVVSEVVKLSHENKSYLRKYEYELFE